MKLSGNEVVDLHMALVAVAPLKGVKFAYGVAKNKMRLENELKALQAGMEPSDEYATYEKKRMALCRKYATTDDKGVPQTVGRSFVGLDGNEEFEAKIKELQAEHKEALDAHQAKVDEYNELLNGDFEFDEYIIALKNIPEDITAGQLGGIITLVEDTDDIDKEMPKS